ncbi:MAG: response regulator transcription factor [Verrucomicrobia bacterium]|nr:response regulator transcription factor [Verrucomicrobiota bacterium]
MPITVSIVEDDAPGLEILASIVDRAPGFRCVSRHGDAESAIKALPGINPDVVLMDIHLPGQNGVECVRQLKLRMPATQFLMLTVYEDTNHIFQALAAGATGYLIKNASGKELIAAIREIHAGGSPMASNIARKVVQSFMPAPATPEEQALTAREKQVLDLLAEGQLYKEIADALHISTPTVCSHIRRIYEKLHVQSRSQAVARYRKQAGMSAG